MASSNSPCAACKFLRRKCTPECVFAPYFPPDQPQKFANVHKVFGASNVAKLLNELIPAQREDTVNSLAYESEARLHDPIYGCVGHITILQNRLKEVQFELLNAKKELCTYIGPQGMMPIAYQHQAVQHAQAQEMMNPFGISGMGLGMPQQSHLMIQQQQMYEQQQMATMVAAREQQELYQQQQHELLRFSGGATGFELNANDASTSRFNLNNNGASTNQFNLNSGAGVGGGTSTSQINLNNNGTSTSAFNVPSSADLTIPLLPSYDNMFQPIDQHHQHDQHAHDLQQELQLQVHILELKPEL